MRLYGRCDDKTLAFTTLYTAFGDFRVNPSEHTAEQAEFILREAKAFTDLKGSGNGNASTELLAGSSQSKARQSLWRLSPWLQRVVEKAVELLGPRFGCLHLRRGDFKAYCAHLGAAYGKLSSAARERSWLRGFTPERCYPSVEHIGSFVTGLWALQGLDEAQVALYVSTDRPAELRALNETFPTLHTNTLVYRAFSRLGGKLPSVEDMRLADVMPFIEQEICMRAELFIGNYFSTFSRRIIAGRSHHPKESSIFLE